MVRAAGGPAVQGGRVAVPVARAAAVVVRVVRAAEPVGAVRAPVADSRTVARARRVAASGGGNQVAATPAVVRARWR